MNEWKMRKQTVHFLDGSANDTPCTDGRKIRMKQKLKPLKMFGYRRKLARSAQCSIVRRMVIANCP